MLATGVFQESSAGLRNALIRTHHITSRKKVAKLRQAAAAQDVFVLLRSGGSPGIMYAEGLEAGVSEWVSCVQVRLVHVGSLEHVLMISQRLQYKDYQLAARVAPVALDRNALRTSDLDRAGLHEVESVKAFAEEMSKRAVLDWWRRAMGYAGEDGRL